MPRKALLCVLRLDVRSVSAWAAAGRKLEEEPRFALPAPLPAPLPSLSRLPALPARGFFCEAGPGPVAERAAALRLQFRLAAGQLLPLLVCILRQPGPVAPRWC